MKPSAFLIALAGLILTLQPTACIALPAENAEIEKYLRSSAADLCTFTAAFYRVKTTIEPIDGPDARQGKQQKAKVTRTYYGVVDCGSYDLDAGTPLQYTEETQEWMYAPKVSCTTLPCEVETCPIFLLKNQFVCLDDTGTLVLNQDMATRIPQEQQELWGEPMRKEGFFSNEAAATRPALHPHGVGQQKADFYAQCEKIKQALAEPDTWPSLIKDAATRELLLLFAAESHNKEAMEKLLQLGAPAECAPYFNTTPLSYVSGKLRGGECDFLEICEVDSYEGQTELIKLLLQHGANPNTPSGLAQLTPLMLAVRSGNTEAVQLLLQAGARVNTRDSNGMNALHWAVAEKRHHMLPLLVEAELQEHPYRVTQLDAALLTCYSMGEKYNTSLRTGMTPLHTAAELADEIGIRFLLSMGANPHIPDRFGRKAIDLLPEKAAPALRQLLEQAMAQPVVPQRELAHIRQWAEDATLIFRLRPQKVTFTPFEPPYHPESGKGTCNRIAEAELYDADGSIRRHCFNAWDYTWDTDAESLWQQHKEDDELVIVNYPDTDDDGNLTAHPELRVHLPYHPLRWQVALETMKKSYRNRKQEDTEN